MLRFFFCPDLLIKNSEIYQNTGFGLDFTSYMR